MWLSAALDAEGWGNHENFWLVAAAEGLVGCFEQQQQQQQQQRACLVPVAVSVLAVDPQQHTAEETCVWDTTSSGQGASTGWVPT
jgi:hypothetical protein